MEQFKDIAGYEGLYQVSNTGKIKSMVGRFGGVDNLKQTSNGSGYSTVTLCKDGKRSTRNTHRLVAAAFLGESTLQVLHNGGSTASCVYYLAEKVSTSAKMKGGNQDELYKGNDPKKKLLKAKMLESVWPQYAKTVIRFNRYHHYVDWNVFKSKAGGSIPTPALNSNKA